MYEKFVRLLEDTGKTAYQVSKETGIPESTLYMWAKRRGGISTKTIVKLSRYFEVPVSYFMND